jgi:hypothetical protein
MYHKIVWIVCFIVITFFVCFSDVLCELEPQNVIYRYRDKICCTFQCYVFNVVPCLFLLYDKLKFIVLHTFHTDHILYTSLQSNMWVVPYKIDHFRLLWEISLLFNCNGFTHNWKFAKINSNLLYFCFLYFQVRIDYDFYH